MNTFFGETKTQAKKCNLRNFTPKSESARRYFSDWGGKTTRQAAWKRMLLVFISLLHM